MPDPEQPIDLPADSAPPAVQPTAAPPENSEATVTDTGQLLQQAELKARQHHDAWLRAMAEAENVRKRAQVELASAYKYAIESVAAELLPVRDSLEATLAADSATLETLKSGVELTLRQLDAAFDKTSLREINPIGEKFDPHRHQAISMLPSEKEPNTVINVLQKGYSLHDRVIRPALVTVAKPRDAKA